MTQTSEKLTNCFLHAVVLAASLIFVQPQASAQTIEMNGQLVQTEASFLMGDDLEVEDFYETDSILLDGNEIPDLEEDKAEVDNGLISDLDVQFSDAFRLPTVPIDYGSNGQNQQSPSILLGPITLEADYTLENSPQSVQVIRIRWHF